jgi:hypothetical protein
MEYGGGGRPSIFNDKCRLRRSFEAVFISTGEIINKEAVPTVAAIQRQKCEACDDSGIPEHTDVESRRSDRGRLLYLSIISTTQTIDAGVLRAETHDAESGNHP